MRQPLDQLVPGRQRGLPEHPGGGVAVMDDREDPHAARIYPVSESLRGQLLIAAPSLFDYFRRTVVLVIEHTPEGAMGVVLNRESETRVAEAVPQLAELADADELVRIGGPVAPESVVALGEFDDIEEAGTKVTGQLGTLDPDAGNDSLRRLRVYAGYAGGRRAARGRARAGGLGRRARRGRTRSARGTSGRGRWSAGRRYRLLATMPPDPSLN